MESDVLIYDTEKERVFSSPLLAPMACYETFPTFTPDGNYLLFCSADSVCMPENYRDVRYNLLRVAFDPKDGSIGTQVDTLYNAREAGRSVKFPRVSRMGSGYFIRCPIMAISLFGIRMRICICWICLPGQSILCRK